MQNGLLAKERKAGEVYYSITGEAARGVRHWQETLSKYRERIPLQLSGWNGEWSVVHLGAPADKNTAGAFTEAIRQAGYGTLGGSLWVSPYDFAEKMENLARECGIEIFQFRGKQAGGRNSKETAQKAWPLESLSRRYSSFEKSLAEALRKLDQNSINGGSGLPFLHTFGLEFFEVVQDDPQLPLDCCHLNGPGCGRPTYFWKPESGYCPEPRTMSAEYCQSKRGSTDFISPYKKGGNKDEYTLYRRSVSGHFP